MKVVVTNAVLANSGDAAICLGLIEALQRVGVIYELSDVVIFDRTARASAEKYPNLAILQQPTLPPNEAGSQASRLLRFVHYTLAAILRYVLHLRRPKGFFRRFEAEFAALDSADLVVSTGGTYLVEHYRIWSRLIELLVARLTRRRVVLWTQSMGPFARRSSRLLLRLLLRGNVRVLLRDERSRNYLSEVTHRPSTEIVADAAFALGPRPDVDLMTRQSACVCMRSWPTSIDGESFDSTAYEDAMRAAARGLLGLNLTVVAASTCQGIADYSIDDSRYAVKVLAAEPDVHIDDQFRTPDELLELLSQCRVVVATRMHMAILALIAGCQVIAIAYEFKTTELFVSLGLGDFCEEMSRVDSAWIDSRLGLVASDASAARLTPDQLTALRVRALPRPDTVNWMKGWGG